MGNSTQRVRAADVANLRESIERIGLRVHLTQAARGSTVVARMWHYDGHILGRAGGYGYDKWGAAFGEALSLLWTREELAAVHRDGLYGLSPDGRVEGGAGLESMIRIVRALGFDVVDKIETGTGCVIVARKRDQIGEGI